MQEQSTSFSLHLDLEWPCLAASIQRLLPTLPRVFHVAQGGQNVSSVFKDSGTWVLSFVEKGQFNPSERFSVVS